MARSLALSSKDPLLNSREMAYVKDEGHWLDDRDGSKTLCVSGPYIDDADSDIWAHWGM